MDLEVLPWCSEVFEGFALRLSSVWVPSIEMSTSGIAFFRVLWRVTILRHEPWLRFSHGSHPSLSLLCQSLLHLWFRPRAFCPQWSRLDVSLFRSIRVPPWRRSGGLMASGQKSTESIGNPMRVSESLRFRLSQFPSRMAILCFPDSVKAESVSSGEV
jgi:hypothetical protein